MIFFGYTERHFDYTLPSFQASTAGAARIRRVPCRVMAETNLGGGDWPDGQGLTAGR